MSTPSEIKAKAFTDMKVAIEAAELAASEKQKANVAELAASVSLVEAADALRLALAEAEPHHCQFNLSPLNWIRLTTKGDEQSTYCHHYQRIVFFLKSCSSPIKKRCITAHFVGNLNWDRKLLNQVLVEMRDDGLIEVN